MIVFERYGFSIRVPNTTFWLVNEDEICGCSHLRHYLNEELEFAGGHIGSGIRLNFRGKSLSKILLGLNIKQATDVGIKNVHILCYQGNTQSKRMIESTGTVRVRSSTMELEESSQILLRYVY